jgi:hypothetical protein
MRQGTGIGRLYFLQTSIAIEFIITLQVTNDMGSCSQNVLKLPYDHLAFSHIFWDNPVPHSEDCILRRGGGCYFATKEGDGS